VTHVDRSTSFARTRVDVVASITRKGNGKGSIEPFPSVRVSMDDARQ
jgi:hypothetical protein